MLSFLKTLNCTPHQIYSRTLVNDVTDRKMFIETMQDIYSLM